MRNDRTARLGSEELEALRRLSVRAAETAGRAISQRTGLALALRVPRVRALPLDDVPGLLGGDEAAVVALHLSLDGETRGSILIAFEPTSAGRLLSAILPLRAPGPPSSPREMTELEQSGLLEIGNILAAAYLNAVSHYVGRSLLSSVPRMAVDMAGAVVDDLLVEVTRAQDSALVIETELSDRGGDITGHILLLPDPATLAELLAALRQRLRADSSAGM